MKKLWNRINLTLGFFTTLPVKYVEWNEKDNKYMPILIPFVGIIISAIFYGVLCLLNLLPFSPVLKSIIMIVYFILITGGLHLDGFLDTCDAHFSRRPMERKLEIMKDSNIGAFAAVFFFVLMSVKFGVIYELFSNNVMITMFLPIPVISRLFQSILLLNSPFAKDDGLARMYGSIEKKMQWYYVIYYLIIIAMGYVLNHLGLYLILIGIAGIYLFIYRRFAKKQFGGITGDVIGAYIEIVEVLQLIGVLVYILC